ncbi:cytochrome P450 [Podospora didyma]|uniref:Cytochrome P450 n=1 Tax=Podospora didyma TaxID=330526 RepID=A0AAE0P8L3_9PEZI|nr:cytochrome P450 [Podospora didyma]
MTLNVLPNLVVPPSAAMASLLLVIVSSLAALALRYIYNGLFPRPLSGIPYTSSSVHRMFGDLGQVKAIGRVTRETSSAFFEVARALKSPVVQLLAPSFLSPIIVVDDGREIEDILNRRNREFDRGRMTTQFFRPMFPHCTIAQETTPALRAQKRLWSDVMGTEFLRRVVAPNVNDAAGEVVQLWRIKNAQTANGGAFSVRRDFSKAALDVIWVAILGSKLGVVQREIDAVVAKKNGGGVGGSSSGAEEVGGVNDSDNEDVTADHTITTTTITSTALPPSAKAVQHAMEYLNEIVDEGFTSVFPSLAFWRVKMTPRYWRFKRIADAEVRGLMEAACARFQRIDAAKSTGDELDTCAMDMVLRREIITAKRAGKPIPDPTRDPAMLQELLLMLIAGHDSTANTLSWFVKIIANRPTAQDKLRQALVNALPSPKNPSAHDILDADIPYLDATVEETVRLAATAGAVSRRVLVDTTVLGHHIPAGANILLNTRLYKPQIPVPEELRSASSQAAYAKKRMQHVGFGLVDEEDSWSDLDKFRPERWLVIDENEEPMFDPHALPSLVFGGGLRGCFGKRLAIMELRIMIVHIILNFEFLPLPAELDNMAGEEKLFRGPRTCHVKLKVL